MCQALGWLADNTVSDLHALRKIRNRFAHNRMPDGLDDSETAELLARHQLLPRFLNSFFATKNDSESSWVSDPPIQIVSDEHLGRLEFNVRTRLIMASALTAWTTMAQLYVAPTSMRTGIEPSALLDSNSESAPEGIVAQAEALPGFLDALLEELWIGARPSPFDPDRER